MPFASLPVHLRSPKDRATQRRRAGQYRIVNGCTRYRNFKAHQRRPWITMTKQFIMAKLKANDLETRLLVAEAEQQLGTLYARPMSNRRGTPLERAQAIIGNIIKQGKAPVAQEHSTWKRMRATALDIVLTAMATDIMYRHWDGTPLRTPYYRAVQIGKAIHFLLRDEVKVYEWEDRHGRMHQTEMRLKIGLTSRYVCQRLQQITERIYGGYMMDHGHSIASLVLTSRDFTQTR